jgi:hypothetical protein
LISNREEPAVDVEIAKATCFLGKGGERGGGEWEKGNDRGEVGAETAGGRLAMA